ncbi:MAG: hypothetical protein JNL67_19945 [Planctomycetaceae bacterium]|nr:hypothetical protein [Planctomycetaceae bacterium]
MTVRLLLLMAIGMALLPIVPSTEQAVGRDVTVLSRVPLTELQDPMVAYAFQSVVVLSSVCWLLHWLAPFSCWVTVFSFAGLAALRIENSVQLCHSYWILLMLLVVHALWYTFYTRQIASNAAAARTCYPAWVLGLSVLVLAWFHTLSGIGKWQAADPEWINGWNWADGVSLQMWLQSFGNPNSRLVQFLLQNVDVARTVQQAILAMELAAVFALISPILRRGVGIALVVYYAFFLHCFVDWQTLAGSVGLGAATVDVPSGAEFPLMSYGFCLFWVVWVFLLPDRVLGQWKSFDELPSE